MAVSKSGGAQHLVELGALDHRIEKGYRARVCLPGGGARLGRANNLGRVSCRKLPMLLDTKLRVAARMRLDLSARHLFKIVSFHQGRGSPGVSHGPESRRVIYPRA